MADCDDPSGQERHLQEHPCGLAAEYRRLALWGPLWWSYCVLLLRWNAALNGKNPWGGHWWEVLLLVVFCAPTFLWTWWAYRWRICLDERGMRHRQFRAWHRWDWSEFESGAIEAVSYYEYRRRLRKRVLSFARMEPDQRDFLAQLCYKVSGPLAAPASPHVPEELMLSRGIRPRLLLGPGGLLLKRIWGKREYPWRDVCAVHVEKPHHAFSEVVCIKLELPDRALRFTSDKQARWSGAKLEVLGVFLCKYVAADRVHVVALAGPLKDSDEIDGRRMYFGERLRRMHLLHRCLRWAVGPLLVYPMLIVLYVVLRGAPLGPLLQQAGLHVVQMWLCVPLLLGYPRILERFGSERLRKELDQIDRWRCESAQEAAIGFDAIPEGGEEAAI